MFPSFVLFIMSMVLAGQSKRTGWAFVYTNLLLLAGGALVGWQFDHNWEGLTEAFFQLLTECILGTVVGLALGIEYLRG